MQEYRSNSYLFGGNAPYVEEMYEAYLDNPGSVPDNWRSYFDACRTSPPPTAPMRATWRMRPSSNPSPSVPRPTPSAPRRAAPTSPIARKQVHVQSLIAAYRFLGSRWADLDPLKRQERPKIPELEPAFYDLTESDMDIAFSATNTYFTTAENMTLRADRAGAAREPTAARSAPSTCTSPSRPRSAGGSSGWSRSAPSRTSRREQKKHILDRLTAAEGLERYLHTKYVGQKRFSLEGGESFIASMDELVQRAGAQGVQEIVIGMAHRGRLNVLVNTLGKMPKDLFSEFDHTAPEDLPSGDVKYHQGFSSDVTTPGRPGAPEPRVQPVAPRDRQPGRRRLGQGAPRPPRRHGGRLGAADHRARRRRLRRPGRRDGDAGAGADRAATTPAARSTSSSTTRSASPPAIRATRARRCTAPTSSR